MKRLVGMDDRQCRGREGKPVVQSRDMTVSWGEGKRVRSVTRGNDHLVHSSCKCYQHPPSASSRSLPCIQSPFDSFLWACISTAHQGIVLPGLASVEPFELSGSGKRIGCVPLRVSLCGMSEAHYLAVSERVPRRFGPTAKNPAAGRVRLTPLFRKSYSYSELLAHLRK